MHRRLLSCLLVSWVAMGCDSGESPRSAPASASAAPVPAEPPPPPPTPRSDVTFSSEDGAVLAGALYLAADRSAPSAVLVHRLLSERAELEPLVGRLARAKKRYTVLSFDLAGHGASKAPAKSKPDDVKRLTQDVRAAIRHVEEATGGRTRSVVLVGSSFGATLSAQVAFDEPKVAALALVSPGAAIRGQDIYEPYAEVRSLPTFFAAALDDTIAKEPMEALTKMAKAGTVKRYAGKRHSAGHLAEQHPALWDDLVAWLMQAYDAPVTERRSLKYAPGKEPGAKKAGGGKR